MKWFHILLLSHLPFDSKNLSYSDEVDVTKFSGYVCQQRRQLLSKVTTIPNKKSPKWNTFFFNIGGHQSFLWGHWYPCFGLSGDILWIQSQSGQPYSHLGRVYMLHSLRFTSGATPLGSQHGSWAVSSTYLAAHSVRSGRRSTNWAILAPLQNEILDLRWIRVAERECSASSSMKSSAQVGQVL